MVKNYTLIALKINLNSFWLFPKLSTNHVFYYLNGLDQVLLIASIIRNRQTDFYWVAILEYLTNTNLMMEVSLFLKCLINDTIECLHKIDILTPCPWWYAYEYWSAFELWQTLALRLSTIKTKMVDYKFSRSHTYELL